MAQSRRLLQLFLYWMMNKQRYALDMYFFRRLWRCYSNWFNYNVEVNTNIWNYDMKFEFFRYLKSDANFIVLYPTHIGYLAPHSQRLSFRKSPHLFSILKNNQLNFSSRLIRVLRIEYCSFYNFRPCISISRLIMPMNTMPITITEQSPIFHYSTF